MYKIRFLYKKELDYHLGMQVFLLIETSFLNNNNNNNIIKLMSCNY